MKKFRGKSKYYKRLLNGDLNIYFENLDFNSWFDFWHNHPDWFGYGNISWKHRNQHLLALLRRFEYLKNELTSRTEDFQTFCIIDPKNSCQDAVYIHTENPNKNNFPVKVDRHDNTKGITRDFSTFLGSYGYTWFMNEWNRDGEIVNLIYLYDENIGLSI